MNIVRLQNLDSKNATPLEIILDTPKEAEKMFQTLEKKQYSHRIKLQLVIEQQILQTKQDSRVNNFI